MATTTNKQKLLHQVMTQARKCSENGPERNVLEQFIFGLCRQSATTEQAEAAFARLKSRFFDWNEIRVSSYREVEEALEPLACAEAKAHRIILFLQEVFEQTFSFDLDKLQKDGLKKAIQRLARFKAADDYVCSWVAQRSLAGHALPVDTPTLRCAQRLGLIEESLTNLEAVRSSLEHQVAKAKGVQFTEALSLVACEFCHEEPRCADCPLARECPSARSHPEETSPSARRKPK
jgi:endonuclease-3